MGFSPGVSDGTTIEFSATNSSVLSVPPLSPSSSSSPPPIVSSSADSSISGANVFVAVGVLAHDDVVPASMPDDEEVEREESSAVADDGRTMSPTFSMLD